MTWMKIVTYFQKACYFTLKTIILSVNTLKVNIFREQFYWTETELKLNVKREQ